MLPDSKVGGAQIRVSIKKGRFSPEAVLNSNLCKKQSQALYGRR
jgi:hypothetical protein